MLECLEDKQETLPEQINFEDFTVMRNAVRESQSDSKVKREGQGQKPEQQKQQVEEGGEPNKVEKAAQETVETPSMPETQEEKKPESTTDTSCEGSNNGEGANRYLSLCYHENGNDN
ncbi:uncharacterized protein LOC129793432 [Lutzomyia longipalpis]|uniref:uncharacterized protein LOC129793432 n=1 Tax=Lutzomyia longipalpis TaxID=7200 RepID=UPI002483E92E|nr:uncharacterized protein LOC129793432 [Lutzomyia longipalpis]